MKIHIRMKINDIEQLVIQFQINSFTCPITKLLKTKTKQKTKALSTLSLPFFPPFSFLMEILKKVLKGQDQKDKGNSKIHVITYAFNTTTPCHRSNYEL